jgi:hypothetical protein
MSKATHRTYCCSADGTRWAAFEVAGVEFIAENGGGPGVRLAQRKAKARR